MVFGMLQTFMGRGRTMFASDIGMDQIEGDQHRSKRRKLRLDAPGGLLGDGRWRGGALSELFALPESVLSGREKDGLTYPVAIYDHDEGRAVTDGFAYHGRIAALRGKFVFGDIQNGRVFAADLGEMKKADDGIPLTVARVEEIQLYVRDPSGNRHGVSMRELVDQRWAPASVEWISISAGLATASSPHVQARRMIGCSFRLGCFDNRGGQALSATQVRVLPPRTTLAATNLIRVIALLPRDATQLFAEP